MRGATTPETRTTSEILGAARGLQAHHGGAALLAFVRALRGAAPGQAGGRGSLGVGRLVLH